MSNMSGRSFVVATVSGNFSCFSRSTFNSQSRAVASRPDEAALAADGGFSPARMKAMVFFTGSVQFLFYGYGLQDLVMTATVAPLAQGLRTAAEDVLQGPPLQAEVAGW